MSAPKWFFEKKKRYSDVYGHKFIQRYKCIIENYTYKSHMTSLNKSASSNSRTDRSRNIVDLTDEHRIINKVLFSKPMIRGDRGSCVCVFALWDLNTFLVLMHFIRTENTLINMSDGWNLLQSCSVSHWPLHRVFLSNTDPPLGWTTRLPGSEVIIFYLSTNTHLFTTD